MKLPGTFWGMTAFFNPIRHEFQYENYRVFRNNSKLQGLKLIAVELAFDDDPFALKKDVDAEILIQIRGTKEKNFLWQREQLLNIALEHLPEDCDKLCWLDCDIVFKNNSWVQETSVLLEKYRVVQPFEFAVRLPKGVYDLSGEECEKYGGGNKEGEKYPGYIYKILNSIETLGATGFVWGMRKEIVRKHLFYSASPVGGADAIMAHSFRSDKLPNFLIRSSSTDAMKSDQDIYASKVYKEIQGSVYYANGPILHLWHGDEIDKRKNIRDKIPHFFLFSPSQDVRVGPQGLQEWSSEKPEFHRAVREYFEMRSGEGKEPSSFLRSIASVEKDLIEKCRTFVVLGVPDTILIKQLLSLRNNVKHIYVLPFNEEKRRELKKDFAGYGKMSVLGAVDFPRFLSDFSLSDDVILVLNPGGCERDIVEELIQTDLLRAVKMVLCDLPDERQHSLAQKLKKYQIPVHPLKTALAFAQQQSQPKSFILLTAANKAFQGWLEQLKGSAAFLNYPMDVYDLGGLGQGAPHALKASLDSQGNFHILDGKWKTRALHKPDIVLDCLTKNKIFTVYLDADTLLLEPIDEIVGDYDVGVTIRRKKDVQNHKDKGLFKYSGYINAGVLFFNHTPATLEFIKRWQKKTEECMNDQMAINQLINPEYSKLGPNRLFVKDGVRIRTFSSKSYNCDYRAVSRGDSAQKIVHFKSTHDRKPYFKDSLADAPGQASVKALLQRLEVFAPVKEYFPEISDVLQGLRDYDAETNVKLKRLWDAVKRERLKVEAITRSYSWRLTFPLRFMEDLWMRNNPYFKAKKRKDFIEIVDRCRLRIENKEYLDQKWLRPSEELFDYYYKEYSHMKIRRKASVYDLGSGAGFIMWFLKNFSGCDVRGLEPKEREDYHALWQGLGIASKIDVGRIERFRPVGYPATYDSISATGICFDRIDNNKENLWGVEEYVFFIKDACDHLEPGGVLYFRFNERPQIEVFNLFKSLNAWEGGNRFRLRRENFLKSRHA